MKTVPAGEFKAKCLSLLDEVARKKIQIVVTKHGKSVAQVVPCPESEVESVNPLKDSLVFEKDMVNPIGDEWEADR
jgi:prevent-host-death family protein